jgi:hypothetical protein
MQVGAVSLSVRLYGESQAAGVAVEGVVRRHLSGWQDARALALEIFEGFDFRLPEAEVIRMAPDNPRLPKYLREALLPDRPVRAGMQTSFQRAQLQVSELATPALRAAYQQLLDAVEALRTGAGQKLLDKQIEVAFYERMRYFAQRIAQTELHRAYAEREALLLMEDEAVQYVQLRRAPGRGLPCICVLFTGRDLYNLGPGVYPKADAPVPPLHPFCRCVMSPRLDLNGRKAKERDEDGDAYFLRRLDAPIAARIVGSQAKLARVMAGDTAEAVANASRDPLYRIKRAGQV